MRLTDVATALPTALMFWPTSRSYTGQPMAELHTIGSPPLLDAVLEQLFANGARSAGRGEFTMRAFLAGRLDLVQAEAVLGVIDATDHEELQTALSQLGGGLTSRLSGVRSQILALLGDLEAGLDFVEEDIQFISAAQVCDRLQQCKATLLELAEQSTTRLPSGYCPRIVLAGLPNAGKSTLFNQLVGAGKAIVSPLAGTTRDYLTGVLRLGSIEAQLVDTAGWEATESPLERESAPQQPEPLEDASRRIMQQAQQHRHNQVLHGDLIVWCTAADLSAADQQLNQQLRDLLTTSHSSILDVVTRTDLTSANQDSELTFATDKPAVPVSAVLGTGIAALQSAIQKQLLADRSSSGELLSSTAARCRDSLQRSLTAIQAAIEAATNQVGDEIVALELRDALHQIATILGEVYTDDILGHIFSNFCIGK